MRPTGTCGTFEQPSGKPNPDRMATQQEIDAAFARLREEWNRAERAIKIAEQVEGEIVNPAIYELRYAGRRIVEAYDVVGTDPGSALQRLQDAQFDCCRARHDAIDAATSKMVATLDNSQEKLGIDVVMTHFAEFPAMIQSLGEVRDKIAISRERREDRDAIYASIEAVDLVELTKVFSRFRACEPLMRESARRNRRQLFGSKIFGWAGVIGLILTVLAIFL